MRRDDARGQRRLDLAFRVVAVLALFSWTNFGALRGGGDLVHRWEQYHFFFGSKYLPEIGYFNLYKATILADRESAQRVGFVRTTRDLTTFDDVPVETALADAAAVRGAFSRRALGGVQARLDHASRAAPPTGRRSWTTTATPARRRGPCWRRRSRASAASGPSDSESWGSSIRCS